MLFTFEGGEEVLFIAVGGAFHVTCCPAIARQGSIWSFVGDAHALRSLIGSGPITHCALHSTALARHIP